MVRQVADLVEEQRAFVGRLDLADGLLDRAGEGAALVAEQLAFQQVFRDGAAVDGDERLLGARAEVVQRAGQRLLAGAALAEQQHGDVGGRQPSRWCGTPCIGPGGDDALDGASARGRFGEAAVLVLQLVQPGARSTMVRSSAMSIGFSQKS